MSGIYIHIPFCKKACNYCNFHFSTSLKHKNELIESLVLELQQKINYLPENKIETIYFGGGTPSILEANDLEKIVHTIYKNYSVNSQIECTLEANPDDISPFKIKQWKQIGINRLSIGIQSFFDEDLTYMNRTHNGNEAKNCIQIAQENEIENISIDLIFGFPLLTAKKWEENINTALSFSVPHLSCYAMTVEPKTVLENHIKNKKIPPINNEQSATHFEYLMHTLASNHYEHYEISNYAKPNHRAIHNSNYWKGKSYIGIGPSAHSFNGNSRQWNIANNAKYIQALHENTPFFEIENLTPLQKRNEEIMIAIRTIEGVESKKIFSLISLQEKNEMENFLWECKQKNWIEENHNKIYLTTHGKLMADYIASELFSI